MHKRLVKIQCAQVVSFKRAPTAKGLIGTWHCHYTVWRNPSTIEFAGRL